MHLALDESSVDVMTFNGANFAGGRAAVGGFKHALVSVVSACVAQRSNAVLRNVPDIHETTILCSLIDRLGVSVELLPNEIRLDCRGISRVEVDSRLSGEIHGSLYLVPALMAACGEVSFAESGGCQIGDGPAGRRPIHHMLQVLRCFGGEFSERNGRLLGRAPRWTHVEMDMMSFSDSEEVLTGPLVSGATKTAIIAASGVKAPGRTRIDNPYRKPDVTELLEFIRKNGSSVSIAKNRVDLTPFPRDENISVSMSLISDLSEVMTFIALSVAMRMPITIDGVTVSRVRRGLAAEIQLLELMGVSLAWGRERIVVTPPAKLRSVDIEVTSVGIYSDHQPFFAVMLLDGHRPAHIRERVWKDRFSYAEQLQKMGACIDLLDREIVIYPSKISAPREPLVATDLRGAAALVIAACKVGEPVTVTGLEHLKRGYGSFAMSLRSLGVGIHAAELADSPDFASSELAFEK